MWKCWREHELITGVSIRTLLIHALSNKRIHLMHRKIPSFSIRRISYYSLCFQILILPTPIFLTLHSRRPIILLPVLFICSLTFIYFLSQRYIFRQQFIIISIIKINLILNRHYKTIHILLKILIIHYLQWFHTEVISFENFLFYI